MISHCSKTTLAARQQRASKLILVTQFQVSFSRFGSKNAFGNHTSCWPSLHHIKKASMYIPFIPAYKNITFRFPRCCALKLWPVRSCATELSVITHWTGHNC
nr:g4.3 [Tranosema rostrale ichnovirus]